MLHSPQKEYKENPDQLKDGGQAHDEGESENEDWPLGPSTSSPTVSPPPSPEFIAIEERTSEDEAEADYLQRLSLVRTCSQRQVIYKSFSEPICDDCLLDELGIVLKHSGSRAWSASPRGRPSESSEGENKLKTDAGWLLESSVEVSIGSPQFQIPPPPPEPEEDDYMRLRRQTSESAFQRSQFSEDEDDEVTPSRGRGRRRTMSLSRVSLAGSAKSVMRSKSLRRLRERFKPPVKPHSPSLSDSLPSPSLAAASSNLSVNSQSSLPSETSSPRHSTWMEHLKSDLSPVRPRIPRIKIRQQPLSTKVPSSEISFLKTENESRDCQVPSLGRLAFATGSTTSLTNKVDGTIRATAVPVNRVVSTSPNVLPLKLLASSPRPSRQPLSPALSSFSALPQSPASPPYLSPPLSPATFKVQKPASNFSRLHPGSPQVDRSIRAASCGSSVYSFHTATSTISPSPSASPAPDFNSPSYPPDPAPKLSRPNQTSIPAPFLTSPTTILTSTTLPESPPPSAGSSSPPTPRPNTRPSLNHSRSSSLGWQSNSTPHLPLSQSPSTPPPDLTSRFSSGSSSPSVDSPLAPHPAIHPPIRKSLLRAKSMDFPRPLRLSNPTHPPPPFVLAKGPVPASPLAVEVEVEVEVRNERRESGNGWTRWGMGLAWDRESAGNGTGGGLGHGMGGQAKRARSKLRKRRGPSGELRNVTS